MIIWLHIGYDQILFQAGRRPSARQLGVALRSVEVTWKNIQGAVDLFFELRCFLVWIMLICGLCGWPSPDGIASWRKSNSRER